MLTRAGEYAIRCILYLSLQDASDGPISRREVARSAGIPFQFLSKIAQTLARAGLVVVTQGSKGGYQLARPPKEITLLQVIETIEGEIFLNACLLNPEFCGKTQRCPVHTVWLKVREDLRATLDSSTFEELAHRASVSGWAGNDLGRVVTFQEIP